MKKREILVDLLNKTNDELERIAFYQRRTNTKEDAIMHEAEADEVKRMQRWIVEELKNL